MSLKSYDNHLLPGLGSFGLPVGRVGVSEPNLCKKNGPLSETSINETIKGETSKSETSKLRRGKVKPGKVRPAKVRKGKVR